MSTPSELKNLSGKWQGTSKLWLTPQEPVRLSESLAELSSIAQEQFTEIQYSWAYEGKPQAGRIILGQAAESKVVKAVWFDTWHMMNQFMICEGDVDDTGAVRVKGSYSAPPGPDWGWQITIEPIEQGAFRLLMHNILPDGQKFLAVEVTYSRQS
jgi:hypothetical protein